MSLRLRDARLFGMAMLVISGIATAGQETDARIEAGRQQFSKCAACHSLEPGQHMMGPSLAGLLGRKAGSVEGFAYTPAMQRSGIVWTREMLSTFLTDPQQGVPGTAMPFGGLRNAEQRAALIEFLATRTLSGSLTKR